MRPASISTRRGGTRSALMVVLFVAATVIAVWLWMRPPSQPTVDAGRSVAEDFLTKLRDGRIDQAWEATTAEFKSAQGKESFARKWKPVKYLKEPLSFVSVQTVSVGEQPRSEYLFQAATGETVRIILGREAGSWKVDRWTPQGGL